ncbi:MAG: sigma-70 family RNA polymerase sigma factor, partial [Prevotellaceae bacterium]|nr:sigma-70 family RNA polymerase sigma factor [Prevotellaceae bacterium]
MNPTDEKQCIRRILDGETEWFGTLVERYGRPLFVLAVQIVGQAEDAEEVVQDTFVNAYRHLSRFRGDSAFSTWIYRIAYRTALSFVRKRKEEYVAI